MLILLLDCSMLCCVVVCHAALCGDLGRGHANKPVGHFGYLIENSMVGGHANLGDIAYFPEVKTDLNLPLS